MSYSGDAAEQVVRLSLEGAEVAAKLTGSGAKEVAVLLYAIMKDQKKTKGKARLASMLRSGKELKVFAVQDKDLAKFSQEAKKYGVLYCVLKDRDAADGITDVMVRAEDASKINRIFERFQLTTVDMTSVRSEIQRAKAQSSEDKEAAPRENKDVFLDALKAGREEEENPTQARGTRKCPSVPSSAPKEQEASSEGSGHGGRAARRSVRQELKEIRAEMAAGSPEGSRGQQPVVPKTRKKKSRPKER
jgi:hypothetical protein